MQDYAHPVAEAADEGTPALWRWIRGEFGGIARLITRTDKTFVAAVNGAAAGVGLAFALACDVILVSERARIVPAFGRIGLLPEVGNSWLLTRRLGYQGAYALFASGRHLSGAEALELGLANGLVAHDELLGAARGWCARIDELPDHVARMMKPLLRATADLSWEQAITLEEFAEPGCFTTRGPPRRRAGAAVPRIESPSPTPGSSDGRRADEVPAGRGRDPRRLGQPAPRPAGRSAAAASPGHPRARRPDDLAPLFPMGLIEQEVSPRARGGDPRRGP